MRMVPVLLAVLVAALLAGCSTAGGKSTSDPRVKRLIGQQAQELPADGTWLNGATSLASLRGRVVYLQFAFPT